MNSSKKEISNSPLVSVGIPTYNRPDGLNRTLECITGQTYKNLEIIISDNCSPGEKTTNVINLYLQNDFRIKYYKQKKNMGMAYNSCFVLDKASADFFMWATDDDEWAPTYIEKCIQHLIENRDLVACTSNWIICQNVHRKNRSEKKYWKCTEDFNTCNMPAIRRVKKYILNSGTSATFGIYRKKFLIDVLSTLSQSIEKVGADRLIGGRLNLIGPVMQIPDSLFIYHHGEGASLNPVISNNKFTGSELIVLKINPIFAAYLNMIIDSLSWPVSITDHIRVIGYYLARMAKAKYLRYTMKTPFFGTPLYDYKPPEYPKRE
jgi:glycosyltransferase involved in cell wall biosynthesis